MSNSAPANDLDRAIMAVQRSKASLPELYRQLAAGELWFLLPYHPEIEGELLELKNGSPLPFASLTDQQGEAVPLFSSEVKLISPPIDSMIDLTMYRPRPVPSTLPKFRALPALNKLLESKKHPPYEIRCLHYKHFEYFPGQQ